MKKETKVTSKIVTNIVKYLLLIGIISIVLGLFFISSTSGLTFVFGPTLNRMLHVYRNCYSYILIIFVSLTLSQAILACLWKPARKWKLLMFFIIFDIFIFVEGYIDYTTRKDVSVIFTSAESGVGCGDCLPLEPHKLEGTPCQSQDDCGGVNSGAYCDYNRSKKGNTCIRSDVWSFCDNILSNCNDLGYRYRFSTDRSGQVTYFGAQNLCASIGKKLYDAQNLEEVCENLRKETSSATGTIFFWISGDRLLRISKGGFFSKCSIEQKDAGKVSYANCICQ